MPWKETCAMDQKLCFVAELLKGDEPLTVLCEQFGITRQTGAKWRDRYRAHGLEGLVERPRAPRHHGRAMPDEVADRIIELRRQRPHWGPRKLLAVLERENPATAWPAASSIGDLLRREGLSEPRKRRRRPLAAEQPFRAVRAANDVWCMDFKGWFRTGDGTRCDPLTVTDAHSRYLLACRIIPPVTEAVKAECERLFRDAGMPLAIRSDNGPPFAALGAGGLSRLAVWWVKLGIELQRIEPGKPQQNGRHERMHRTLKHETSRPAAATAADQQLRFDRFRQEFNRERPHEALGQEPPAWHWQPSLRPFPERIEEPWYDADHAVRRVRPSGEIRWGGDFVFISESLVGEPVGITELEDGSWIVRFASLDLGIIDRRTKKLRRFGAGRPPRPEASSQTEPAPC